jgi:RNA polymerase sigma-70 factor (ECF subfamily)
MSDSNSSNPKNASTDTTSLTLLERIKSQDAAAWEELVEVYRPLVFSWCQRSGLNREDCEDLLQEVFASVAAKIGQFRRERAGDTFRGWLRIITRNQVRLYFRRGGGRFQPVGGSTAQRRIQELPEPFLDIPDAATEQQEAGLLFQRGLEMIRSEFEPRTWQAFWLTTVDEFPSAEVCQRLQMTAGAVRQAKYKVLRRLRAKLGDTLE